MSRAAPRETALKAALLGAEGLRRAFPLVAFDRPKLELRDWIWEGLREFAVDRNGGSGGSDRGEEGPMLATEPDRVPARDRPLSFSSAGGPLPRSGVIGLSSDQGCLFAVFGYQVLRSCQGDRTLVVRGPSMAALIGEGLVRSHLNSTIERLAGALGCAQTVRKDW